MDQQAYLQRLKSIRDKYGCRDMSYNKPILETSYPNTYPKLDSHNPEYTYKPYNDKYVTKPGLQLQDRQRYLPTREYDQAARQPRSYSVYEKKMENNSLQKYQYNEAQIKRQQNFTDFIKDLDTRIEQKEKVLRQRFKDNEALMKKTQNQSQVDNIHIQRYSSHKDIKTVSNIPDKYYQFVPRSSFQKSGFYLDKKANSFENRQTDASSLKIQASPARKKFAEINNIVRQTENTPLASPSLISKKLDKKLVINRQGWNPNKLESIQQRIKYVLKQSNN